MAVIRLFENDPIVRKAVTLAPLEWTEVGRIPGDVDACKMYAHMEGFHLVIKAEHGKECACERSLQTDDVIIVLTTPVQR